METDKIGTTTEGQQTQDAATVSGQQSQNLGTEPRNFTQDEVNRLIAKELKPFKEIKSEYEKIKQSIQAKEDAEKSDLQKAMDRLAQLEPYENTVKEYESALLEILETELANIPEEMRSLIPDELSVKAKLSYITKNRSKLIIQGVHVNGVARTTQQATAITDKLTLEAERQMGIIWPNVRHGSDEYKLKIDRIHQNLKKLSVT